MPLEHPYERFTDYDRRQVALNERNNYEPPAMTCFHAHQIVEKTLKDRIWEYIVEDDGSFDQKILREHNLVILLNMLLNYSGYSRRDPDLKGIRQSCMKLTDYYKGARYPFEGDIEFDANMAAAAISMERAVVEWLDRVPSPSWFDSEPATSPSIRGRTGCGRARMTTSPRIGRHWFGRTASASRR